MLRMLLALSLAGAPLSGQTAAPESAARRIIEAKCVSCHGASKMAGLDLRQRPAMLTGGSRGASIVPGKPDESLLYKAVKRDGDLKMPPGKAALGTEEVEAIRAWIAAGAPWTGEAKSAPSWWSFRKITHPPVPAGAAVNPIDRYVNIALSNAGLTTAPAADRRTLIRRLSFDLHGLPPDPADITRFLNDKDPQAYEKLVDRLLQSPRYGERWGRHWLDVVRYADTGGFETDVLLANAWRYRDYVIRSFNSDKPFDTFVKEQIAADEIWPDNLDLDGAYEMPKSKAANLERRLGTSLYSLGALPVEFTFFGDQWRAEWQAEAVETTAAAFLGLTFNCARCHDHKFDPITQKDYYRLSAVFAGSEDREVPIVSQMGVFEYTRHGTKVVAAEQLKRRLQLLDAAVRERQKTLPKGTKLDYTAQERDQRESLLRQLGEAYMKAPNPYAKANLLVHTAPVPDTHVLAKGEFKQKGDKVAPGFPSSLGPAPAIDEPADTQWFIPRRRKALAEWLTSRDHPLLARVMVNRVWGWHFGKGLVATPNDMGRQGDAPSHPELLDWLAAELMENGWSLKKLHRQILLSDVYRRSSEAVPASLAKDAENRLLWRMNRRRLEAEEIRDTILATSGGLNAKMFGEPVVPELSREEMDGMRDPSQWPITADPAEHDRRSVYLFVKRSFRNPMMEVFNSPDASASCARREESTVAPQSLAMMNGEFLTKSAARFAVRLKKDAADPSAQIDQAWRIALGRMPDAEEKRRAAAYAASAGLEKLCLLVLNLSEMIYVD